MVYKAGVTESGKSLAIGNVALDRRTLNDGGYKRQN